VSQTGAPPKNLTVFATVGTHYDGFPRMLRALESVVADRLIVQHGHGAAPSNADVARGMMPFAEMLEHFQEADVVITHAGVGSILLSLHHGHVPVVIPRWHRLGEHVDDHQVELTKQLESRGLVVPVWDEHTLADTLLRVPPRSDSSIRVKDAALPTAVRRALFGDRA
jgi:UDP-N-acetylglucosamine transferase subunit ALG13